MPIPLECECGKRFQVADSLEGRKVACPGCRRQFHAPLASLRVVVGPPPRAGIIAGAFRLVRLAFTGFAVLILGLLALAAFSGHKNGRPDAPAGTIPAPVAEVAGGDADDQAAARLRVAEWLIARDRERSERRAASDPEPDPGPSSSSILARPVMPPTPAAVPSPRRVVLIRPGDAGHVHFCLDRDAYDRLRAALAAGAMADFSRLSEAGRILRIPNGTAGLVVADDGGVPVVRLAAGPHAGRDGWVDPRHTRETVAADVPDPGPRPSDPAARARRAETIYRMGQNLERSGHRQAALEHYRRVVVEFGETRAAVQAGRRVAELAGK